MAGWLGGYFMVITRKQPMTLEDYRNFDDGTDLAMD